MKLHPGVADCLVVGVPDDRFGEAVTAVCRCPGDARRRRDELAAALDALARFKRPRRVRDRRPEIVRGPERQGRLQVGKANRASP